MWLQAKDIVLSDSLEIIPLHSYQAKCLLTGPLQNKIFETQQSNSRDYPKSLRLLAFPQRPPARLLRHLVSIHFAYHDARVLSVFSTLDIYNLDICARPILHETYTTSSLMVAVGSSQGHPCKCVILLSTFL